MGRLGLGKRKEAEQDLIDFCKEKTTGDSEHIVPTPKKKTLHMDIT